VTRTLRRGSSAPHAQRPPRQRLGPNADLSTDAHAGVRGLEQIDWLDAVYCDDLVR